MDTPGDRPERRDDRSKPAERRSPAPTRGRGESSTAPNGGRPPQEPRRKRHNEQRYAGFGDGVERAFCGRAARFLPRQFPVESHGGAATIPQMVVARRPGAHLLCTYSHCGEHIWPDGEVVGDLSNTPE